MERNPGDIFKTKDNVTLKCIISDVLCTGCVFLGRQCNKFAKELGECSYATRLDGLDVAFDVVEDNIMETRLENMLKFRVSFVESLKRDIIIYAMNSEDALEQAKQMYKDQTIVLSADDYSNTEILVTME